jgi:hypothetical protein
VRDNYDAFHKEIDTMYEPHFCAKNFHYLAMQLPIKAGTYKIKNTFFKLPFLPKRRKTWAKILKNFTFIHYLFFSLNKMLLIMSLSWLVKIFVYEINFSTFETATETNRG